MTVKRGDISLNRALEHTSSARHLFIALKLFYWRERNDEVDFILQKKGSIVAIEVKSNAEKNTNGLEKFRQMFNPKASFIVGDGGIGVEDFLSMDINKLF